MSSANSFQIIDLIALTDDFDLHTNHSCRFASESSQKWLSHLTDIDNGTPVLSPRERSGLTSMKMGLLAALCFPRCDAPQLRVLTDFLTLLFISNARVFSDEDTPWHPMTTAPENSNGIDILASHTLFKQCVYQFPFIHSYHSYDTTYIASSRKSHAHSKPHPSSHQHGSRVSHIP